GRRRALHGLLDLLEPERHWVAARGPPSLVSHRAAVVRVCPPAAGTTVVLVAAVGTGPAADPTRRVAVRDDWSVDPDQRPRGLAPHRPAGAGGDSYRDGGTCLVDLAINQRYEFASGRFER